MKQTSRHSHINHDTLVRILQTVGVTLGMLIVLLLLNTLPDDLSKVYKVLLGWVGAFTYIGCMERIWQNHTLEDTV